MRVLLILFIVLSANSIKAQQLYFDHFTVESGLTDNNVSSIIQDDLGYVWLGSLNGLNRYNGYGFDVFLPSESQDGALKGNMISSLSKGKDGNIWAVTLNGGLNFYDGGTESFHQFPDSIFPITQSNIHNIIEAENGDIHFISAQQYYSFNQAQRTVKKLVVEHRIASQFQYSKNENWLISLGKLLVFNTSSNRLEKPVRVLEELDQIRAITRDPFYEIHILTDDGIYHYNEELSVLNNILDFNQFASRFDGVPRFTSIASDGNNYWVKHGPNVYRIFKNNYKYEIEVLENIPLNTSAYHGLSCRSVFVDNGRNTWITTNKNGVNIFNKRKNQFKHYYPYDLQIGLQNLNPVRAICKTKQGDIWLGFENKGLGYYKKGDSNFYPFDLKRLDIGSIRVIFEDSKKNIWIGSRLGVFLVDQSNLKLIPLRDRAGERWKYNVYSIKESPDGRIWIGGSRLGFYDPNENAIHYVANELALAVRDFSFEDQFIWIATDGRGVVRYDKESLELNYYQASGVNDVGLCDNKVYSICVQDDIIWAGTNSGLSRIDRSSDQVKNYFKTDGLSNNVIYAIESDEKANLWISTAKGISRFDVKNERFSQYLHNRLFLDDAVCKSPDKQILFGGYNGFVAFDPDQISPAQTGNAPVFKSMNLNGEKLHVGDSENLILKKSLQQTNQIELDYDQNSFSFEFSSSPIIFSGLTSYQYILEGYQQDWESTFSKENRASFTQVPPGEYLLQVRSTNEDGIWGTNERRLAITISPPFWGTTWFRGAILFLFIMLIYTLVKMRERNIKRRNVLLEEEVEAKTVELKHQNLEIVNQKEEIERMSEKLHEADQAKLRFFTNVSHELKTPLTLIMGHLEMMTKHREQRETSSFHIIKRNASKLLGLVNDIVDFRKASQGELKLKVGEYDGVQLIQSLVTDFSASAKQKRIKLQFVHHQATCLLWFDQLKFEKIIGNLLSNAIKYTPEGGEVVISISDEEHLVRIQLSDTGQGIQAKDQEKIFDRFFRSDSNQEELGHGIGLALVKSMVELHDGQISLESSPDNGSCFTVTLKKGKIHFSPESLIDAPEMASSHTRIQGSVDPFVKEPLSLIKAGVPSILIVEDNPELLDFLCDLLKDNYSIERAMNGVEGIKRLENFQADLIISDIMMPQMDGITFCQKVKKDIRFSHIPFILLTAKSDIETRIEGFQLGIDDYIEKPFNVQLIQVRIEALLANREKLKGEYRKGQLILADESQVMEPDKVFLEKVWGIIESHFANPEFSVEYLGTQMGMSRASFFRKFKSLTGQTASEFIKSYRIQQAKTLIQNGHKSVGEIGTLVGYQSPSQFRKAFNELVDMSPSEYIKSTFN